MKDMKKNCEITEEEKFNYEVKKIEFIIEEIKDTERRFSESIHEVIQVKFQLIDKVLMQQPRCKSDVGDTRNVIL